MPYDKKKLGQLLKVICDHTQSSLIDYSSHRRIQVIGGAGSVIAIRREDARQFVGKMSEKGAPTLHVTDDGCDAFEDFVNEVLQDEEMANAVGRQTVSDRINEVLRDIGGVFPESDESDPALFVRMNVLKPLREQVKEWTIYVPVVNLKLVADLEIGDVIIRMCKDGLSIQEFSAGRFDDSGQGLDEEKRRLPDEVVATAGKYSCWASTTIRAAKKCISPVARRKLEPAINALRAFTHTLFARRNKCIFDMAGFVHTGSFIAWGRDEPGTLYTHSEVVGYLVPFELTEERLAIITEQFHFDTLKQIVATSETSRNSFQEAICVASYWLGRAAVATTFEDEFVRVAIALERLLIIDGEETTTERIALRLPLLIAEQLDQRKSIQKTIKRLYDIRSKIVHAGYIGVTEDEANEMGQLTTNALACCLKLSGDVDCHSELRELLNQRMLQ